MLIRQATAADTDLIAEFTVDDPVGFVNNARYREESAAARFRPEWTWLVFEGPRLVGRALWWGRSDSPLPLTLDCLHVAQDGAGDRHEIAAELISRAHLEFGEAPDYLLILPAERSSVGHAVDTAVSWRTEAAASAGLTEVVERLQFEWTPAAGVPAASTRLVFRSGSDEEFLAAFERVAVGSLDATTQRDLEALGARAQAMDDFEFYRSAPGERSWWRLAEAAEGGMVGFAIPSATPRSRNVGYLGVVPERRGQGYVEDLLGEITRIHAGQTADRITATTDLTNLPMASAFGRAGYELVERRIVFSTPPG